METVIALGVTLTFNILILFVKANSGRYVDLVFDILLLLSIGAVTSGSVTGLTAGMIASTAISLFLLFKTPKIVKNIQHEIDSNEDDRTVIDVSDYPNRPFVYSF